MMPHHSVQTPLTCAYAKLWGMERACATPHTHYVFQVAFSLCMNEILKYQDAWTCTNANGVACYEPSQGPWPAVHKRAASQGDWVTCTQALKKTCLHSS